MPDFITFIAFSALLALVFIILIPIGIMMAILGGDNEHARR